MYVVDYYHYFCEILHFIISIQLVIPEWETVMFLYANLYHF